jgi:hypothetical protein
MHALPDHGKKAEHANQANARANEWAIHGAGGHNGSTYTLTYDPATDVLRGTYFQAVAQRKFDVYFIRIKQ